MIFVYVWHKLNIFFFLSPSNKVFIYEWMIDPIAEAIKKETHTKFFPSFFFFVLSLLKTSTVSHISCFAYKKLKRSFFSSFFFYDEMSLCANSLFTFVCILLKSYLMLSRFRFWWCAKTQIENRKFCFPKTAGYLFGINFGNVKCLFWANAYILYNVMLLYHIIYNIRYIWI